MSETPRTDAVYDASRKLGWGSVVDVPKDSPPSDPWELARDLEKELTALRAQNKALREALEAVEWQDEDEWENRDAIVAIVEKTWGDTQ